MMENNMANNISHIKRQKLHSAICSAEHYDNENNHECLELHSNTENSALSGHCSITRHEGNLCRSEVISDNDYFRSYSDLSIHRVMIGDYTRTHAYRRAIIASYQNFYGKVVVDVGAGTGILSAFCVQAGAKKVYAVEASPIAEQARKVVEANGMQSHVVVLQEKAEELKLPEKVDVIVSEWMGYMLMYEWMLPSVLHVRDHWLKEGGLLFPMCARIFIAPLSDPEEYEDSVDFWKQVHDTHKVDTSVLAEAAEQQLQGCVWVKPVDPICVQSHPSCIAEINLNTVTLEQLELIEGCFRCSCFGHTTIHGFVVWFSVEFPNNIVLSTSPYDSETHWEQSILYVPPFSVEQDTLIEGSLVMKPNVTYCRFLDVELHFKVEGREHCLFYKMNS